MVRIFIYLVINLIFATSALSAELKAPIWHAKNKQGIRQVQLYYFYLPHCRHCQKSGPFLKKIAQKYPWLHVKAYDLSVQRAQANPLLRYAKHIGHTIQSVPMYMFCNQVIVGFDLEKTTGKALEKSLVACHKDKSELSLLTPSSHEASSKVEGLVHSKLPLPIITVLIAALDAFNPCAFFVLFCLLSLMARGGSRKRLLTIGGIFVLCSGFVYFVFICAWLNLFLITQALNEVTIVAAIIAVLIAFFNIRDFFSLRHKVNLSISETHKRSLFSRMNHLVRSSNLVTMVFATLVLAVVANLYELLCTAGLPMVFTRILTLHQLSTFAYYSYVALYCVIYMIPLLIIVILSAIALSKYKLSESKGRLMKLGSGVLMLFFGISLLFFTQMLFQLWYLLGLVVLTILIVWLAYIFCPNL